MLNALGVTYPQYWVGGDCEIEFSLHLNTLKAAYVVPKVVGKEGRVWTSRWTHIGFASFFFQVNNGAQRGECSS